MSEQDVAINQLGTFWEPMGGGCGGISTTFLIYFSSVFQKPAIFTYMIVLPKNSSWSNDQSNFVQFVCSVLFSLLS